MPESEPLENVNKQLAATSVRIAMVPIGQCDLLEQNAGFMTGRAVPTAGVQREA